MLRHFMDPVRDAGRPLDDAEMREMWDRLPARKSRLFICAWCRVNKWHELFDEDSRRALEVGERYADGLASQVELEEAWDNVRYRTWEQLRLSELGAEADTPRVQLRMILETVHPLIDWGVLGRGTTLYLQRNDWPRECGLLRDIFGNPFHPVTILPGWQTTNVVGIAQAIYAERTFEDMPILGDALEDASCTNADILKHCREPAEHVRGCWVVDLVLGKS
jgi:hypothetical protein